MISICIPVFNFPVKDLVGELSSQISQINVPAEIVLIDDGSAEAWRKENREACSGHEYIQLEQNVGRARIRNLFLQHVKYDHLLFLDCDSKIVPDNYLEAYVKAAVKGKDHVICGGRVVSADRPERKKRLRWKYGKIREGLPATQRMTHPHRSFMTNNFLVPGVVLREVGFDERISGYGHEDTLFGYRLKRHGITVTHIDNPVLNGHLETNSEFLRKTREGIFNLVLILGSVDEPGEFSSEVTLLRYYGRLRSRGLVPWVRFLYTISEPLVVVMLSVGVASLKLFDFFKLGWLIRILRKESNPADSE